MDTVSLEEIRKASLKWALKNAFDHDGRAQVGPVVSKVIAELPSARAVVNQVVEAVKEAVEWVNTLDRAAQEAALSEIAPKLLLEAPKRPAERQLPDLPKAVEGAVVLRLPPEPSGYMHLGHAFHGLVNYLYRERYRGFLWLRFEDTNPKKVKPEYYESYREGYRWCGVRWDAEKNNSDDMILYYDYARRLLEAGHLYVCSCSKEEMARQRAEGLICSHRSLDTSWHLEKWDAMLSGSMSEGEAAVRFRGDPLSQNTALRDPVLFRIVDHPHPLKGEKFIVWPTYDFAAAIQDAVCGVTHVLRTSEFMFRDALQDSIRERLGLKNPVYVEYSRFEFEGTPLSRRRIRELIERGVVGGWDDPRLGTVLAARRRGITPEALKEFVKSYVALTPSRKLYSWDLLYAINKRILDPKTPRLFFTPQPRKLIVKGMGRKTVTAPLHPSLDMGSRVIEAGETLYIAGEDAETLRPGDRFRLKYLANLKVLSLADRTVVCEVEDGGPEPGLRVLQWVPEGSRRLEVIVPDLLFRGEEVNLESLRLVEGLAEPYESQLPLGSVVQFERFGYCVKDSPGLYVFTHR
ncbi:MAG: glutamate--tRNA ligase [Nitrososphaerota archaeon]|nr:glutamate--tRNA ligase [Candidatus Calditenuaceae archaeon]MDW8073426.1 glutamate--tRNA ligase [Nitrososphaerota archaeon]